MPLSFVGSLAYSESHHLEKDEHLPDPCEGLELEFRLWTFSLASHHTVLLEMDWQGYLGRISQGSALDLRQYFYMLLWVLGLTLTPKTVLLLGCRPDLLFCFLVIPLLDRRLGHPQ